MGLRLGSTGIFIPRREVFIASLKITTVCLEEIKVFKKINESLLKKMVPTWENTQDVRTRAAYGYLEGWVSIVLNALLAGLKICCGLWINSISLLADAFHTLSDVLTSIAVIVGFKIAEKPQDAEHPFGHGRAEYVSTFLVSTLLIIVGIQFLQKSIDKLFNPEVIVYSWFVFAIMIFSAFLKEWMYDFSRFLGIKINSKALIADAWHHRSDAIASLLIAVALFMTQFGYYRVDAVLGIVVSFLILYTGFSLIKDCASEIIGKAPSQEFVQEVQELVSKVEGVKTFMIFKSSIWATKYVNIHIEVEPEMNVLQSHKIAKFVEGILNNRLKVSSLIHIDPFGN